VAGRRGDVPAGERGGSTPGATDEEEAEIQRRHQIWLDEQVAAERGGLILLLVAPASLCVFMATLGATRKGGAGKRSARERSRKWLTQAATRQAC